MTLLKIMKRNFIRNFILKENQLLDFELQIKYIIKNLI